MTALVITTILVSVAAFFVCGIPFGMIIAARMGGVDVRKVGSGNIGMTNVARSAGGKAGGLTLLCDAGKGTVCMIAGKLIISAICFGGDMSMLAHNATFAWASAILYMACVLGHIFSPYLHFHGGKGISVGFGAAIGFWWPVAVGLLVVFLALTLPTRYVSLGSVAAAASLPIQCFLWGMPLSAVIPPTVVAAVVIWSHRENIGRLMRGEERKFSLGKGGKK